MSMSKKMRELNRARIEHDKSRLMAGFAESRKEMVNMVDAALASKVEVLRQQLDWVKDVLSAHGYVGPFGDGCCPLADWLNERDELRQQLADANHAHEFMSQQYKNLQRQLAAAHEVIEAKNAAIRLALEEGDLFASDDAKLEAALAMGPK